jgi:hypothetical protein
MHFLINTNRTAASTSRAFAKKACYDLGHGNIYHV